MSDLTVSASRSVSDEFTPIMKYDFSRGKDVVICGLWAKGLRLDFELSLSGDYIDDLRQSDGDFLDKLLKGVANVCKADLFNELTFGGEGTLTKDNILFNVVWKNEAPFLMFTFDDWDHIVTLALFAYDKEVSNF